MGYDSSFHVYDPAGLDLCRRYVLGEITPAEFQPWIDHAIAVRKVRYRAKSVALRAREAGHLEPFVHVWGRPFLVSDGTPQEVAQRVAEWYAVTTEAQADALIEQNLRRQWAGRPNADGLVAQFRPGEDRLQGSPEQLAWEVSGQLHRSREAVGAVAAGQGDQDALGSDGEFTDADVVEGANFLFLMDLVAPTPGWMSRGNTFVSEGLAGGDVFPLGVELMRWFPNLDIASEPMITGNDCVGATFAAGQLDALPHEVTDELVAQFAATNLGGDLVAAREELTKIVESVLTAELLGYGWCEAMEIYSGFLGHLN